MKTLGLIGYPLEHSFSKSYFENKFQNKNITGWEYQLFQIKDISTIITIIKQFPNLRGLNVTIPYKTSILPYLNEIDPDAKEIGAVNCLKISREKNNIHLEGYNTDAPAFLQTIKSILKPNHRKALILGTGGSSRAVSFALNKLQIEHKFVSRNPQGANQINYANIDKGIAREYPVIINTTPLGMFPNITDYPAFPYNYLTPDHLLFDLVYNPAESEFLKQGKKNKTQVKNGYDMLKLQAELSWEIWNEG